jgi:hypothetical protein
MDYPRTYEHSLEDFAGWLDRSPIQILESMATSGCPDALEMLRNIPHHANETGRSPDERLAIDEHIKAVVVKLCVQQDLEINIHHHH